MNLADYPGALACVLVDELANKRHFGFSTRLFFSADEWDALTPDDIDAAKTAAVDAHVANIEQMSKQPAAEPTKQQLLADTARAMDNVDKLEELLAQKLTKDDLNVFKELYTAKLAEVNAAITNKG